MFTQWVNNIVMATIHIHHCKRCGHDWPSKNEHPNMCPKCKSRFWDTPKKRRTKGGDSIGVKQQTQNKYKA